MSKLVEEASSRKSRTQRFIDNFAKYYIPGKYKYILQKLFSSVKVKKILHQRYALDLHYQSKY